MSKSDDLFDVDHEYLDNVFNPKIPEMTCADFVEKTKNLLKKIDDKWSSCTGKASLTDEMLELIPEDIINTVYSITFEGKEYNCYCNWESGDWEYEYFDSEEFGQFIEDLMFHDNDFYYLINCTIKESE